MVKISVITVVYNRKEEIITTLNSVVEQDYSNLEIVVVDGGSTDGTVEFIREMSIPNLVLHVEKDEGIYDAMNKGIKLSTGDYIIFMNTGDRFISGDVLSTVSKYLTWDVDGLYGGIISVFKHSNVTYTADEIQTIWKGKPFSHQAVLVKSEWLRKKPFNLTYPICADYDHTYWMYSQGAKFLKVDTIFAFVDRVEGSTGGDFRKVFWDNSIIMLKYGNRPRLLIYLFIRFYKEKLIKEILPQWFVQVVRKIKQSRR